MKVKSLKRWWGKPQQQKQVGASGLLPVCLGKSQADSPAPQQQQSAAVLTNHQCAPHHQTKSKRRPSAFCQVIQVTLQSLGVWGRERKAKVWKAFGSAQYQHIKPALYSRSSVINRVGKVNQAISGRLGTGDQRAGNR